MRGMLKLKRAEIEQSIEDEQVRLARVEARLSQIEQESKMSNYDVIIKKVAPQCVAAVCEVIGTAVRGTDRVQVRELPGIDTMACAVHHGPFNTLNQAYSALMQWIQTNNYRIVGPN